MADEIEGKADLPGTLQQDGEPRAFHLDSPTLVGRDRLSCHLPLTDARVSSVHARLQWGIGGWYAEDMGSRNGTWLNGARITPGTRQPLEVDNTLAFGHRDAPPWRLTAVGPPLPLVLHVETREQRIPQGDIITLPDGQRVTITATGAIAPDGRELQRGDFVVPDGRWQLWYPDAQPTVLNPMRYTLRDFTLVAGFAGDTAGLTIIQDGVEEFLGYRKPWIALRVLIQARLDDPSDVGWLPIEDLTKRCCIAEERTAEMWCVRARHLLARYGVENASEAIESNHTRDRRVTVPRARLILRDG
ncbi:MAG TPA: FHA domain-containing protein [Myxococcota bacterium]|nr:FHA domain-containing protein [Myxococcota bacterium]